MTPSHIWTNGTRAAQRLPRSLVCPLLALALFSGCSISRAKGSGDGKVIDFLSKQPIPDVAVELTCYVPKGWHGHDTKTLRTVSATDGSYHFDTTGLHDCVYFHARGVKPGYGLDHMTESLTSPDWESGSRIPKIVYLIRESDQPMVLLERLAELSPANPPAPGPYAPNDFGLIFVQFVESKKIARTPAMIDWVRQHYCARLKATWGVLSEQQRTEMNFNGGGRLGGPVSARPDSFENEVQPYCR